MIPVSVDCDLDNLARNAHEEHERVFQADVETANRGERAQAEEGVADAPGVGFDTMLEEDVTILEEDVMQGVEEGEHVSANTPSVPSTPVTPPSLPLDPAALTDHLKGSHRVSAQNKRSHARRAKQRIAGAEDQKSRGDWPSSSKPPKQHVLNKARHPKVVDTLFTPAQERATPAGAGYTAKSEAQTAADKVPRPLSDFDGNGWRRIDWDGM